MSVQAFQRAKAIFLEASRMDLERQSTYLDQACGTDHALRAEVESLLHARIVSDGDASWMLEPSVQPSKIGPYAILDLIREGGMGTVYKAREESPQRIVALKVIKHGCSSNVVLARFKTEFEAQARMNHANIARIFRAEWDRGHPYFVMEYVPGTHITRYADENRLTIRQRLGLFVQACHAVMHAHSHLIIHRDLKPSNVLVFTQDRQPVVKVIDFGIAKALEGAPSEATREMAPGRIIGSLDYMSPEQVRGDADIGTGTDVYSLGVLLYQLLAGVLPFDTERLASASLEEQRRIICQEEPPAPAARVRELTGDEAARIAEGRQMTPAALALTLRRELEWIPLKAMQKETPRRYASPMQLAEDIGRYLENRPLIAGPVSRAYRLRKFVLQRRGALGAMAAVFLVLLAGIVGTTAGFIGQRALRLQADQRAHEAEDARQQLQDNQQAILQARDAAQRSRRDALLNLFDAYTAQGLDRSISNGRLVNGLAGLWFANAALLPVDDPQRTQANLVRLRNWLADQWEPVAAFEGQGLQQSRFDPQDPRYLMTWNSDPDPTCEIWDLAAEKPLLRTAPNPGVFIAGTWMGTHRACCATAAGDMVIVSVPTMQVLRRWSGVGHVTQIAASHDGQLLAAATGRTVRMISVVGGPTATVDMSEPVGCVVFAPTAPQLLAVTGTEARLFTLLADGAGVTVQPTLQCKTEARDSYGNIVAPAFVQGGAQLAVVEARGTRDVPGTLKWYDIAAGKELASTKDSWLWTVGNLTASADGKLLGVSMGVCSLYTTDDHKKTATFRGNTDLFFSPHDDMLGCRQDPEGFTIRRLSRGSIGQGVYPEIPHAITSGRVAMTDDWNYLALSSGRLVRVFHKPPAAALNPAHKVALAGRSSWVAYSPDSKYVAPVGILDGTPGVQVLQVFNVPEGSLKSSIDLGASLASAAFSPTTSAIAAVTGVHGDARRLHVWDYARNAEVFPPLALESEPVWAAFSPDGVDLAVHFIDGKIILFDASSGHERLRAQCSATRLGNAYPWASGKGTLRFSRDGRFFFTWGSPVVQAWDRATGKLRYSLPHEANCWALADSHDGRTLATASYDGFVHLWDAATGQERCAGIANNNQMLTVDFSADDTLVASTCADHQVRVWQVPSGKLVGAVSPAGTESPSDAVFCPAGNWLVTACNDVYQLWDPYTGFAMTPPMPNASTPWHTKIDISPDGHWLSTAGSDNVFPISDVAELIRPSALTPQQALLWSELLSGSRVSGSVYVSLSPQEWMDLWHAFRKDHPQSPLAEFLSDTTPNHAASESPATVNSR